MKLIPVTPNWEKPKDAPIPSDEVKEIIERTVEMYATSSFSPPWIGYLALQDQQWVGTCAFKRPPEKSRVEIAYFTFPKFEGQGIGTQMAKLLLEIVQKTSVGLSVYAQTMAEPNASNRILQKLGFIKTGEFEHPEDGWIWEWELLYHEKLLQEV